VRHHAEGLLKLCSHAVHEARANDGMALQLDRQGFEEGVALQGMDGRCGGLDRVILVVVEAEQQGRPRARPGTVP
jgi:hypothetical protein